MKKLFIVLLFYSNIVASESSSTQELIAVLGAVAHTACSVITGIEPGGDPFGRLDDEASNLNNPPVVVQKPVEKSIDSSKRKKQRNPYFERLEGDPAFNEETLKMLKAEAEKVEKKSQGRIVPEVHKDPFKQLTAADKLLGPQ